MIGAATLVGTTLSHAAALPVCHGGDRAARHVTCIVDGDTGWENGVKWRLKSIDAPEMRPHAACNAEARRAILARDRLRTLMGNGYRIRWTGTKGYYHRDIVTITLADGRDAGEVLEQEGLAQPWPNHANPGANRRASRGQNSKWRHTLRTRHLDRERRRCNPSMTCACGRRLSPRGVSLRPCRPRISSARRLSFPERPDGG